MWHIYELCFEQILHAQCSSIWAIFCFTVARIMDGVSSSFKLANSQKCRFYPNTDFTLYESKKKHSAVFSGSVKSSAVIWILESSVTCNSLLYCAHLFIFCLFYYSSRSAIPIQMFPSEFLRGFWMCMCMHAFVHICNSYFLIYAPGPSDTFPRPCWWITCSIRRPVWAFFCFVYEDVCWV